MGIGVMLKNFAPMSIYIAGLVFAFLALSGRSQFALWFLICIIPLRNVVEKLHAYPMGKDLIDILLFVLMIGWFIGCMSRKDKLFSKSPINTIAFFLVVYITFSVMQGSMYLGYREIFSVSDPRVQQWKNFCTLPLIYFIVFNTVRDKEMAWKTILVIVGMMIFMDMYLIRQIAWFSSIESRTKIKGTFVYLGPNEIAAFCNMTLITLAPVYYSLKRSWAKLVLLGVVLANIFVILFLFSRAAYIATAIGGFFIFLAKDKKLVLPLIIIALCWQLVLPEKVVQRINQTTNEFGELDQSSEMRIEMWEHSIELFNKSPIFGVGYGAFQALGFELGDTHNIYVKILAEQGILGMFLFIALLMIFFAQGMRLYKNGDEEWARGLGLGFAVCVPVLMINNFFGDRWSYIEVSSTLWAFAGLVARLNVIGEEYQHKKLEEKRKKAKTPYERLAR